MLTILRKHACRIRSLLKASGDQNTVRDFPWSPIAEAVRTVVGCFGIVSAMSLGGAWIGDRIAVACLPNGISSRSFLGHWPDLYFYTPEVCIAFLMTVATLHQALCFPSQQELFKAAAIAFAIWSMALFSITIRLGSGPPPSHDEFIGEWVREKSSFQGDRLSEGGAIYFGNDAFVAVFSAPPLVGRFGEATLDEKTATFTLTLRGDGGPPKLMTVKVVCERVKRRLVVESDDATKGSYTPSGQRIPKWVKEAAR